MRHILVHYARNRARQRDGGCRIALEDIAELPIPDHAELVALDDALTELTWIDHRQGTIVQMKFFRGLSSSDISTVLGISPATVDAMFHGADLAASRNAAGGSAISSASLARVNHLLYERRPWTRSHAPGPR